MSSAAENHNAPPTVRDGEIVATTPRDFRLDSGQAPRQAVVRARLEGAPEGPLVIVAGGISSGRYPSLTPQGSGGWWRDMVRKGGPVDLDRVRVLAFDFVPEGGGGEPLTVTTGDQARVVALLLDAAGLNRADAFIGSSYGGMVALAFAQAFPERVGQTLVISAAHRAHPMAIAWRGIQRRILALGREAGRPELGVALARELAMTTYRTPEEFEARFQGPAPALAGEAYPVCQYLMARGRAYPGVMDEARWTSLSDSVDRHQVAPEAIRVPTRLVGFRSDRLVPMSDLRELASRLASPLGLCELDSLYGHDGFLNETAALAPIVAEFLHGVTP